MATKAKETAAEVQEEVKDNRVDLKIPRENGNEDPNFFISINGKNYLIPRGKTVKVPPEVAAEYHRAEAAKEAFYAAVDARRQD